MERLAALLRESKSCVAFTGAGVSTLSGIRDFRGKNGLYKSFDAEKIFDIDYFHTDPEYYYRNTKDFIYSVDGYEPGIVHRVLARLERKGIVRAVITQNIDLLHQKAGSKNVIEVHGSPLVHRCLNCDKTYTYEYITGIVHENRVPRCTVCNGIIKPDITFFGEPLPAGAINSAIRCASEADLMLVLGSTLIVQPAASLPLYTRQNGGGVVIVNDMATPLDDDAELRYGDLMEVFTYLEENME